MNVLVITCDELRWDVLPCYGNTITSMPAAERLANEGAVFDHTFCQMPKCVPSRCSMLTGRYPAGDGFRTLCGKKDAPHCPDVAKNDLLCIQEDTPNIIPILRNAGFRTCLLGKNHVVEWNLHKKWFDQTPSWDFLHTPKTEPREDLRRASYQGTVPDDFPFERHFDVVTANEVISFIETSGDRPFFGLVDISLPHPCYQTYSSMPSGRLPLDEIPAPPMRPLEEMPFLEQALRKSKQLEHFSDDDRRLIRRAYYSMAEFADRQVARILDALDRTGKADDTLVIYTADHGDFAADHNCYEKWDTSFLDPIVRVPLLMRLPGKIPAGYRSNAFVELVDFFPTILEGLEIASPGYAQGRSLWPLFAGDSDGWRTSAFAGGGVEYELTRRPAGRETNGADGVKQKVLLDCPDAMLRSKMVRTHTHKYIHRISGHHELYDLGSDPAELTNLIDDPASAGVLAQLRTLLIDRLIESEPTLPEVEALFA